MAKWVYAFGGGKADGDGSMRELLGGKGANLAEMARLGLPVPPGFTITTDVCRYFYANGRSCPPGLREQVADALAATAAGAGRSFGGGASPLLVSVRSGSRASMPGMMDTVLNLGLNDDSVEALAAMAGDDRFAWDSYRRFIQMYSSVVLGVDHHLFEDILEDHKAGAGHVMDTDLSAADWRDVAGSYKRLVEMEMGQPFPQDPHEQLWGAIDAVFSSWMNQRAIVYRRLNNIPESWGTAVNVQAMVFGNMGETSATGVAFSRNPSTGAPELYGEFLINAQGEDVVAGMRTPQNVTEAAKLEAGAHAPSMEAAMPEAFAEFARTMNLLEAHYRDMQDVEFTVERGKLWMLQTRNGKRTAPAALRIAVDMAAEGLISRQEAILKVDPAALDQMLHPTIDADAARTIVASGLPASPGAARGEIVFSADDAEAMKAAGRKVILLRVETSPEDIHGMHAAEGVLTTRGGMTSHAAVVARGMGKPCVTGAGSIRIDYAAQTMTAGGRTFARGDILTIDGSSGQVLEGHVAMRQPELSAEFVTLMAWADKARRMQVRANADTPDDARIARQFGAQGIGLCRTEHMFFAPERILAVRQMILASDPQARREALARLLPMQRDDFTEIFAAMAGLPVTIRLLDPPLHEFLPHSQREIAETARAMNAPADQVERRIRDLREANPMLGFRGVRIAIAYPEIADMQARAIFEGAAAASARTGTPAIVEIMIPLAMTREELDLVKARIDAMAASVREETGHAAAYTVGAMIELPRAALRAGELAQTAEFFSFGTNDLTQTALGISRDDSASFLGYYTQHDILPADPFVTLDREGVGELIAIAAERGRAQRANLKLGICGEHGGDPASIGFFETVGLDYVSCSPFRTPIARLAAAQAAINRRAAAQAAINRQAAAQAVMDR